MRDLRIAYSGLLSLLAWMCIGGSAVAQIPSLEQIQFAPRPGSTPQMRGGVPGRFDYYSLVMSWSPTFCATAERPDQQQCFPRDGRRFAFVLHGLWPQYERGYPQDCPSESRPFVPQRTIDRMAAIMPSRSLVIYQYRKHGVCSGLDPEAYYDLALRLFDKVKIPARFINPDENQMVDTAAVVDEFVASNPGLKRDMLGVVCAGPGNRLREVRICFTPSGELRSCGGNEHQRQLCNAPRVFVPPVRASSGQAPRGRGRTPPGPLLPGPVMPGSRAL